MPHPLLFTGWVALRKTQRYHYGRDLSARLLTSKPDLAADEIAVKVTIKVPPAAFTTPTLAAEITVPEQLVLHPEVVIEEADHD